MLRSLRLVDGRRVAETAVRMHLSKDCMHQRSGGKGFPAIIPVGLTLSITIDHFHSIPPFPSRDPGTSREGWKFHGRSREGTLIQSHQYIGWLFKILLGVIFQR